MKTGKEAKRSVGKDLSADIWAVEVVDPPPPIFL